MSAVDLGELGAHDANAELSVPAASVDDLACMKVSAIAGRGAAKDFWDLHVILERAPSGAGRCRSASLSAIAIPATLGPMTQPLRIGIILGSTRTGRFADRPAERRDPRGRRRLSEGGPVGMDLSIGVSYPSDRGADAGGGGNRLGQYFLRVADPDAGGGLPPFDPRAFCRPTLAPR